MPRPHRAWRITQACPGTDIPRGYGFSGTAHRDHRWFPDPEAFRPQRFMPEAPAIPRGAFMPFGAGPHFCIGQQFAMVEMAVIAAQLIRRYDVAFESGTTLPCPQVDLVLKPKEMLRLRFTARADANSG